jgi:hypothetical protein
MWRSIMPDGRLSDMANFSWARTQCQPASSGRSSARCALPAKDFNELITSLKANPGKASAGVSIGEIRLITTFFQKKRNRIDPRTLSQWRSHNTGFGGWSNRPVLWRNSPAGAGRAGTIKAYAVTSDTRLAAAPDIPTFAEMGLLKCQFET